MVLKKLNGKKNTMKFYLQRTRVIGTERHESRRIDNQLRGRAGRQGDPGYSQFYVALDDDIMRILAVTKLVLLWADSICLKTFH